MNNNGPHEPPDTRPPPGLEGGEPFDALFRAAQRDAFSPEQAERLWQSVVSAGPGLAAEGPELPGGTTPPVAPTWGATSGIVFKGIAVLAVVGGLAAAVWAIRTPAPRDAVQPKVSSATAPDVEVAPIESAPPVVSWEDLPSARIDARPPAGSKRASDARTPASAMASGGSTSPAPPVTPVMASPGESGAGVAPEPSAGVASEPGAGAASESGAGVALPSEGALLLRARQELASEPSSALALTQEAGRRFPDGALAPEREVLAIEALARLGRGPEARERLAAFRAQYPQSPHLARLASLLDR